MEEMVLRARRGELDVDPAQVDLIWEGGGRARRQMYVRCPQCGETMARRQDPEARVVIDVCAEHGVWFDRGELTRVIEAVRKGKSRGGLDTPSSQPGDWTRASASEEGAGQHSWVDRMLDFLSTRVHWGDL
jgi:Zn-finger nucleic acid-binding protein